MKGTPFPPIRRFLPRPRQAVNVCYGLKILIRPGVGLTMRQPFTKTFTGLDLTGRHLFAGSPIISPITAAADASAQAILLIPKFTMRLFGIGNNISDEGIQPCNATPGN